MSITAISAAPQTSLVDRNADPASASPLEQASHVRDVFRDFVGETFYRQMLKSMRETVGKPAYFHGGQGEEVFTAQLDQVLTEKLSAANGGAFADGMFAQQFPRLAALLQEAELNSATDTTLQVAQPENVQADESVAAPPPSGLDALAGLIRR